MVDLNWQERFKTLNFFLRLDLAGTTEHLRSCWKTVPCKLFSVSMLLIRILYKVCSRKNLCLHRVLTCTLELVWSACGLWPMPACLPCKKETTRLVPFTSGPTLWASACLLGNYNPVFQFFSKLSRRLLGLKL